MWGKKKKCPKDITSVNLSALRIIAVMSRPWDQTMSFCAYMHNYMILYNNPHVVS